MTICFILPSRIGRVVVGRCVSAAARFHGAGQVSRGTGLRRPHVAVPGQCNGVDGLPIDLSDRGRLPNAINKYVQRCEVVGYLM